tara:strand:- start:36 stop:290 length:255 start_codon:yes stop_codon:yes gene_type:complete
MNDNKLEIFTVPKYSGNAYILETIDGNFDALWTAPLLKDGTVDDAQFAWGIIEDDKIIEDVLGDERIVIADISVDDFVNLLESV